MSKRRDLRNRSNPSFFNRSLDDRMKNSSFFPGETIKSKYIPGTTRNLSLETADLTDYKKEKVFNKNISYFRQSFNQNDPSQLPFMSSLRAGQKFNKSCQVKRNMSTVVKPFEAGEKTTANMKLRKKITDLHGKSTRMTNSFYRWHKKSGVGNKQMTNFECTLRDYNKTWDPCPQEQNFDIRIRPLKYKDVEETFYEQSQLICPRQRRLFCMKMQKVQA